MAPSADALRAERGLVWLSEAPFARVPPADATTIVLVCDLASKPWRDLAPPPSTASDACDARRPGSTPRTFFAARRGLLKHLLAWRIGCRAETVEIGYDADGAPRVASHPAWFVSVGSRDALTAAAIGRRPIGVDVERCSPVAPIEAVLHPDEARALAALDPPRREERFLRLWTMKEAYLKSLGCGFMRDPASIAVREQTYESACINDAGTPVAAAYARWRTFPDLSALAAVFSSA